jgi:hypothetical protein
MRCQDSACPAAGFVRRRDGFPGRWDGLPEQVQARVLALLAAMIARSVLGPGAAGGSGEVPS